MFSPSELDHVAWFLVLLIAAWVLVNALVDVSGDRTERRRKRTVDDRIDGHRD
ncbi:MAG: hypothetical protein R2848_11925 [Thermomicrobiales bacterium]